MARHRLFLDRDEVSDGPVTVEGSEAEHALRSKRVRVGDRVEAINGRGLVLVCRVEGAGRGRLTLAVEERFEVEAVRPAVHVWSATPKGARLDKMIDMLVQVGASTWTPMETKLGVVEPGASKVERMGRIAVEAAKQCGRAHVMSIGGRRGFGEALGVAAGEGLVIADASGGAYRASGRGAVRLLVGSEGGFLAEEMEAARGAGAQVVGLGPHAMRIETAAVVGTALVLERERDACCGEGT